MQTDYIKDEKIQKEQQHVLIAEFMGLKKNIGGGGVESWFLKSNYPNKNPKYFYTGTYNYVTRCAEWFTYQLDYSNSWDWIMPVISEVKEICSTDEWWRIAEYLLECDIQKLSNEIALIIQQGITKRT